MFYTKEKYIRSHNGYNYWEKDILCRECGETIGSLIKYEGINKNFNFIDRDKANYNYCPYCGHRFEKKEIK